MRFDFSPEHSRNNPAPMAWEGSLETGSGSRFGRSQVVGMFLALALVTFILRIFYSTHLYQDDGLWFTAAEEILRGKALYREIYFDKPPALALTYAGLFKIFGAHILTVRLFTIIYSLAISGVLYLFGSWLYDRRTGLIAAAMFAVFGTTYTAGHVQGFNTDFMMALPYTAGAYLLIRSRGDLFQQRLARNHSAWSAFAGGALVGIASQVNPKAIFDLIFFALILFIARRGILRAIAPALAGFVAGAAPFLIYVAATGSLPPYWHYVWEWGSRYASYYPPSWVAASALRQTADYFALNNTLLVALIFVAVTTARRARENRLDGAKPAPAASSEARAMFAADAAMLLWLAVSYAGMAVGGRFFGHYFFQIIPALCLIGSRGLAGMTRTVAAHEPEASKTAGHHPGAGRGARARQALFALLILGFTFTLVRFHGRTVMLAADWVRGAKSEETIEWLHERLNREERRAAAQVKNLDGEPDVADRLGAEEMRIDSPRANGADGPSDYLFVWGYRPEIYYWSGLIPASRYLSTQPLTGVPADVHYFGDEYHSLLEDAETAAERATLLRELEQTRPEYIIDELGGFNSDLSIMNYSELREFMDGYKSLGMVERFAVYRRKDFTKGYRKRNPDAQP
ncbi:MAG TPA: glycosyltransferase family 39 protein [Blastocatellia bacterium]|nr:glycosyltransferase family 39 protein [Blastocatellia bacterium]